MGGYLHLEQHKGRTTEPSSSGEPHFSYAVGAAMPDTTTRTRNDTTVQTTAARGETPRGKCLRGLLAPHIRVSPRVPQHQCVDASERAHPDPTSSSARRFFLYSCTRTVFSYKLNPPISSGAARSNGSPGLLDLPQNEVSYFAACINARPHYVHFNECSARPYVSCNKPVRRVRLP